MLELLVVVGAWVFLAAYTAWFLSSVKKRERERAKFYERFVGIYNSSKDAIGYASLDGVLLDVNDSFCRLTGYSKEELLTKKYQDITPKEYKENEAKTIERILRTGEPAEYEKEYIRKDGSRVPILLTVFVAKGIGGKTLGVAAIIKDITERKSDERAIRDAGAYVENIVATLREPFVVLDKDLKVITANHSFYKTFEVTREEIESCHIYEINNRQWDIPKLRQLLEDILPRNISFNDFEVEYDFQRIGRRVMLLNARRICKEANTTQMILLVIEDITEKKLLQEKLIISEKLSAIGLLASAVGHEIRNPLGVIRNSTYFLNMKLKDNTDEKVMKHLKILEKEVNSANLIISDLLDFARKKPPALEPTDLNNVVMDVLSSIFIPENIKVTTELCEIPPMLLDREQIRRVFLNLTLNAVQAMPEGGKLLIQTSKHFDSVEIAFTDTGVGISKENMEKLFTPLFSTKAKGIGLGLRICKQIVEGHDGNITVQSTVGEGSTFTVKLPMLVKKTVDEKSAFAAALTV